MRLGNKEIDIHLGNYKRPLLIDSGYIALEYIESNGNQYINTIGGRTFNLNVTKYEVDFKYNVFSTGSDATWLFSCQDAGGSHLCDLYSQDSGITSRNNGPLVRKNADTNRHKISVDLVSKKFSYDGVVEDIYPTYNLSGNLTFFIRSTGIGKASARLYSFKKIDNDAVTLNLIPAKEVATGNIGMYDTVAKRFYGNAGTGNFIAGPYKGNKIYLGNVEVA